MPKSASTRIKLGTERIIEFRCDTKVNNKMTTTYLFSNIINLNNVDVGKQ